MKRFLFVIGAFLVAAAGCDREPCAVCAEENALHHVSLQLAGSSRQTKVLDVPSLSESNVVRSTLYVFDRTGTLVDSYRSTDGRFDFYLTDETYDFVAVANKGDLPEHDVTKSGLLASVTTLAENAVGNFVMVGRLDGRRIDSDENLTLEVARRVAKVSYTLRTAFPPDLSAAGFRVEEIYLTNVAGSCTLDDADGSPAEAAVWYNKMDLEGTAAAESPYGLLSGSIGRMLAQGEVLASGHVFYPYPNAAADSHDKQQWGSRCTRFVVKAVLGGRTTWYPVTLEEVRSNRHYHIDLTVSNYGVEHPEDPMTDYSAARASVSAAAWESGGDIDGNY